MRAMFTMMNEARLGVGLQGYAQAEAAYQNLLDEAGDNMSVLAQYQEVEAILDVDEFIDYMIVHYYAGNWDWGQDNWYATFNHVDPNGKWRFHSWDAEKVFVAHERSLAGTGRLSAKRPETLYSPPVASVRSDLHL